MKHLAPWRWPHSVAETCNSSEQYIACSETYDWKTVRVEDYMKKVSKVLPGEASKVLNNPAIFSVAICHLCIYRERRKLAVVVRGTKMDAMKNMHERDRKTRGLQTVAKNYRRPFPAGRKRYCHIWSGCSREVMMIMMIERNRRQKVEEIKKIQYRNGRVRWGGTKQIKRATQSNLKRQEKDRYKK